MDVPALFDAESDCQGVREIVSRLGDKWTVQVVKALRDEPRRFNDIKRGVSGISQQMLTRTLRSLERDGAVERTVHPTTPPQVEYALTDLGHSLAESMRQLAIWALAHRTAIHHNRLRYDADR